MAKWITCKDDPFFYTCSSCNTLSDWRDKQCENCGEEMEDTDEVIAEWGEYKAIQSGGCLNITVLKNNKRVFHAIYTKRLNENELLEYLKGVPEVIKDAQERANRKGRTNEGTQNKDKKRVRRR